MKSRLIYIGIALTVIVSAFLAAFFTANPKPADATVETRSTCMPVEACEATTTTAVANVSQTSATVKPLVKTTTSTTAPMPTTTTSEIPPPLTPEQEAKIPGPDYDADGEFCKAVNQAPGCNTPETEGMGEDTNGTDYGIVQSDEQ